MLCCVGRVNYTCDNNNKDKNISKNNNNSNNNNNKDNNNKNKNDDNNKNNKNNKNDKKIYIAPKNATETGLHSPLQVASLNVALKFLSTVGLLLLVYQWCMLGEVVVIQEGFEETIIVFVIVIILFLTFFYSMI